MENINFSTLGDSALIVSLGDKIEEDINRKVLSLCKIIEKEIIDEIIEIVPTYRDICIFYDPLVTSFNQIKEKVNKYIEEGFSLDEGSEERKNIIEIPVLYGGEFGPDLEYVAKYSNLTKEKVVELHSSPEYRVYMVGFAPGFPHLGGLNEKLYVPRRSVPAPKILKNSVGIAWKQTGIYTVTSPGGWWIIGRSPLDFYKINKSSVYLLAKAGDYIKFKPIDELEYYSILNKQK
jgi:inhibitor of KinA